MSVTPQHKMLCAAAAASLSAMSFLMAAAPVGASPMRPLDPAVPCASYTFPANLTVKQGDGTTVVLLNSVGSSFQNVAASYSTPGKAGTTTGTASGGVTGQENIDFTANWNGGPGAGSSNHYTGVVNKNLTAQGMSTNNRGAAVAWASAPMTLNCVAAPAPVQPQTIPDPGANAGGGATVPAGPSIDVSVDQGNPFLTFTVHNTSTQDLKCEYNAKKLSGNMGPPTTTKDFTLKAGATTTTTELQFLEIPKNTTYQVDISCTGQNGGTTYSHNFSG